MKKLILLLFIPLVFACSDEHNDLNSADFNLKGKVKSVHTTHYSTVEKFGEVIKGQVIDDTMHFKYYFKKDGNYFKQELYLGTMLVGVDKLEFNNLEIPIQRNSYDSDGKLLSVRKIESNDKGKPSEVLGYSDDGELKSKSLYQYDDKGRLTVKQAFLLDAEGSWVKTSEIKKKYDRNGFLIEESYYILATLLAGTLTSTYNNINVCKYKINDKGFSSEADCIKLYYQEGAPDEGYNNDRRERWSELYEYEYDDKGNWIKRITKSADKAGEGNFNQPASIMSIKKIEYYD